MVHFRVTRTEYSELLYYYPLVKCEHIFLWILSLTWPRTSVCCAFRPSLKSTMAKMKQCSPATAFGYELSTSQKYLFTPLTGLSKGSISSVFHSHYIFSSYRICHLHTCWSWPPALVSTSTLMGYPLHNGIRSAGFHD